MHRSAPGDSSKATGSAATSVVSSGVSTVTVAPPTLPPSAIGTPMEPAPDIAPLSPQLPEQFATGGTTSDSSSASPSAPGGGGKTLKDCMGFWDRATHMSKARMENGLPAHHGPDRQSLSVLLSLGQNRVAAMALLCYYLNMTITLTPEQQQRLEAAVAAGQFASVEEAVRWAVDHFVVTDEDLGDLSWAKPYLDEARAQIARGETVSAEEVFAETDAWLKKHGA